MNDINQIILRALGIFKIKFKTLDSILIMPKGNNINIHIDLNSILKILLKEEIEQQIYTDESFTISSAVINIAAHYRSYFAYKKISTKIYFYYTGKRLDNGYEGFIVDRKKFPNLKDNIHRAIDLISIVCKYCEGIYLIQTKHLDPSVCANSFIVDNALKHNLILTKDKMWYQLLNSNNNNMILHTKRDESTVITAETLYDALVDKSKIDPADIELKPELLSLIFAQSGCPSRSVGGVKGIGAIKSIKFFNKAVKQGDILNEYYPRAENLIEDIRMKDSQVIIDNFYKIDIQYNTKQLTKTDKLVLSDQLVDKFSRKDLKMLNVKYYTGFNSLMLEELMMSPTSNTLKW